MLSLRYIFGRNLKYYRYQKRITQEQLAEYVGLSASYISELESGKYGSTFDKIELIAEVLSIKPYMLFQENAHVFGKLHDKVNMK